jgi:hypothetical protein
MMAAKPLSLKARLRRPKRVTLIACFPAQYGTVLCADSLEIAPSWDEHGNVYDLKKAVQKLAPINIGGYQIIIAGMGFPPLIESFIMLVERRLKAETSTSSIARLREVLEEELFAFYVSDVSVASDTTFAVFVAACCPKSLAYAVWVSENVRLREVRSPELIGWDQKLYWSTVKRLSAPGMTLEQAALASIYTLTIAKQTTSYVDDPFHMAIIRPYGIFMEDADYIEALGKRLTAYENQVNQLFLSCSDTAVSTPDLEDAIDAFKGTVLDLHRRQIDKGAQSGNIASAIGFGGLRRLPNDIPLNWDIDDDGPLVVEHDREKIQKFRDERKANLDWAKQHGVEYLTKTIECLKCKQTFEHKMRCSGPTHHCDICSCPNCEEGYQVDWVFRSGGFAESTAKQLTVDS